ncbi:MAG: hypothetical protein UR91_C0033G0003 [Candidatus Nomurabacteria bacterium GW2011_GWC2_35_8]|uniref:Uncharacterized protein n=1 Tax=Candidatus Nomurabacteria bacterium GW2011_GWC2_35_8 TaxID=1618752 RepID=A0A0G0G841_9BACT|nr:MAG: hypothetical protein UR91_C0033G0003 [Candidatus Nomurabacteria bacterium GW2011_GWC2_35_8]
MKKYAISILIIFALIGVFSPVVQISADSLQTFEQSQDYPPSYYANNQPSSSTCTALTGVQSVICKVNEIVGSIVPVLIALGLVYFVWGVIQYMIGTEEETKKGGKGKIIYGIIGLAVIVGVWGLVNILKTTFVNSENLSAPTLSTITTVGTSASCDITKTSKFQDVLCYVTKIINNSIIPLIFALALAMFVWGVVQFVLNSDEEVKKEKGRQFMLWGIIALTVMISVWGLVAILGDTFKIKTNVLPQVQPPTTR